MAIAFSAGGYTRSDFMISDAAMPIRLEELEQLEQTARFSEVLSGIGQTQKSAPVKEASADSAAEGGAQTKDVPAPLSPAEIRKLARQIVSGKKRLEDVPKEQITVELLAEIAKLMIAPPMDEEDEEKLLKITEADNAGIQVAVSEQLAAMLAVQQGIVPEEFAQELIELTAAVKAAGEVITEADTAPEAELNLQEAVQNVQEVQPDFLEQAAVQEELIPEAEIPQMAEEAPEIVETVAAEPVMTVRAESEPIRDELPKSVETDAKQAEQPAVETAQAVTAPQSAEMKQPAENGGQQELPFEQHVSEPVREDIADEAAPVSEFRQAAQPMPEVREVRVEQRGEVREEQAQQPEEIPEEAEQRPQLMRSERVVSKSDELQMIRSSAKPAETEQSAPAAVQADAVGSPVVITRESGEVITVRPGEILEQAAAKLIEAAQEMTENEVRYSITLEPADLGRITVRMTKAADGAVSVSIAAENAHTQRILEENGAVLQANLKNSGINLESWQTVNESQQDAHAEDYRGSSKNPYFAEEGENSDDAEDSSFAELIASM